MHNLWLNNAQSKKTANTNTYKTQTLSKQEKTKKTLMVNIKLRTLIFWFNDNTIPKKGFC